MTGESEAAKLLILGHPVSTRLCLEVKRVSG